MRNPTRLTEAGLRVEKSWRFRITESGRAAALRALAEQESAALRARAEMEGKDG